MMEGYAQAAVDVARDDFDQKLDNTPTLSMPSTRFS